MPVRISVSRLIGSITVVIVALVGGQLPADATSLDSVGPTPLEAVVARLGEEAMAFDGGATWGISVMNLDTGETADFQGDQWVKAASVLKVTWVAAALRNAGVEAVEPYATQVFVYSNNDVSGRVLEVAGGLDNANALTRGLGMNETLVVEWTFGTDMRSKDYPGAHPTLNYTSANDLVTFWRWLYQGAVLGVEETEALLAWSNLPRSGAHAAFVSRLPPEAVEHAFYKTGHLPPGRTYEDDDGVEVPPPEGARDAILGAGVIEVPGGPTYVVSVVSMGGWSWPGKVAFIGYASCRIYEVVSGDPVGCDRPGDPARVVLDTDSPSGRLALVAGGSEFVTVRGWASDPDDPEGTVLVRFMVDGFWSGITRAAERHSWGSDPRVVLSGHGFETTLLTLLPPGPHEICATAINDGSGSDTPIGCAVLVVG